MAYIVIISLLVGFILSEIIIYFCMFIYYRKLLKKCKQQIEDEMKERLIGEEFSFTSSEGEVVLKVVEGTNRCEGCYFDSGRLCGMNVMRIIGNCIKESRSDHRDIIVIQKQ
jgi:hypothetical protein